MPPVNPPSPGRIIAIWSGSAYSTRQAWLISQLTSISEGLSPIRHPGTHLVGDGRPTTKFGVAYSRIRADRSGHIDNLARQAEETAAQRDMKEVGRKIPADRQASQGQTRETSDHSPLTSVQEQLSRWTEQFSH